MSSSPSLTRASSSLFLLLVSGFWILASLPAPAIVDTNNNALSDIWEKHHNNGNLIANLDPQADPDGDGWTNIQEAAAGTNPFDPNPPNGFIRPDIVHIPATYSSGTNGDPVISTPEAITLTWPTLPGKQYTLHYSPDLSEGSWQPVEAPYIGNGNDTQYGIPLTQENGSSPDKLFWRVAVGDIDTDGDGLTDAEEHQFGSSPSTWDTDNDGINDFNENSLGTNPTIPRIWAFKETRNTDGTVTFTWNSYAANGDWFNIENQQPNGTWQTIYATTYGSTKLPFVSGSNSYSLTLNPTTDYQP